jgi:hypothetical protein
MATDLFNLVFNEILKISPTLLSKYATIQDQVIYLILIPTVVLFLFIFAFAKGIVGRIVGEHRGFEYLVSIVTYIYLVYSGIFGTTLVPIFITWLNIAIVVALIFFVMSVVIHPARGPALMRTAEAIGKSAGKLGEKEKQKRAIEEEIDSIKKQIAVLESQANSTGITDSARSYIQSQIANLKARKADLESKL